MKNIKLIPLTLVAVCLLPAMVGCGSSSSGNGSNASVESNTTTETKSTSFSYFAPNGDDSYYTDYNDNPGVRYMTKYMKWGTNKDKTMNLNFQIPAAGTAANTINTMVGTGDYTDIMDITMLNSGGIKDLYSQGIAMDLTPYVEKYMPHYTAWLDKHPEYAKTAKVSVNGEKKYLQLYTYRDVEDPNWGYEYRRDWIAKYGKNPKTGVAFTGGWTNGVWSDDIVFPNGTSDPLYISDWEWMFNIFQTAIADKGITDGYSISLYYPGFFSPGDLVDAFGGHGPSFYQKDGIVNYGAVSDDFRLYLKTMRLWYNQGWLDKKFTEHTAEMYWLTDTTKVHSGRVGIWYGQQGPLGGTMDNSDNGTKPDSPENGYTSGICIYPAPQPINDKYGTDAQKNVTPYNFYAMSSDSASFIVTSKAKDKDLDCLFSWLDYLYSDEGALMLQAGLSKEQFEECQDPYYIKYGLTDGGYKFVDSNGNDWVEGTSTGTKLIKYTNLFATNPTFRSAMVANRVDGRQFGNSIVYLTYSPEVNKSYKEWTKYKETGTLKKSLLSQIDSDAEAENTKINTTLTEFMNVNTSSFITGKYDPNVDTTWNNYTGALKKYKYSTVISNYQNVLDLFK